MNINIKEISFIGIITFLAIYFFKDLIILCCKSLVGKAVFVSQAKDGKYYGKCPSCKKKSSLKLVKKVNKSSTVSIVEKQELWQQSSNHNKEENITSHFSQCDSRV